MAFKDLLFFFWTLLSMHTSCYALNYSSALTNSSDKCQCKGGVGTSDYYYDAIHIEVMVAGVYSFTSSSSIDAYGYLYENSFDPKDKSKNFLKQDDDSGIGAQFHLTHYLNRTKHYVLVVSTFRSGVTGCFSVGHSGSSNSLTLSGNVVDCPTTTRATLTTTTAICYPPVISSIKPASLPGEPPKQFAKRQFFYVSAQFRLQCAGSPSLTDFLDYGTYIFNFTIRMAMYPAMISSKATYITITYSSATANLVKFGTSIITNSFNKPLILDPGAYSEDPDAGRFNARDWTYSYYCQLFNMTTSETIGQAIPIGSEVHPCFINRSDGQLPFRFDPKKAPKSSLTILPYSFQRDRFYQFSVRLVHRQRLNSTAEGSVIVNVTDTPREQVSATCVVSTMCSSTLLYHLINPTTQVALFSESTQECLPPCQIQWNIYYKMDNITDDSDRWIPYKVMNNSNNQMYFGANTTHFTATNHLFMNNSHVKHWRFEVIYFFQQSISTSALNFEINDPPKNGTCSIDRRHGSTTTVFTIDCVGWRDEHEIRDYSIYAWTTDESNSIMLTSTGLNKIELRLPPSPNETYPLNIRVHIQDTLGAVTKYELGSVYVQTDREEMFAIIDGTQLLNDSSNDTDPIRVLLSDPDQNIQSQILTSLSKLMNDLDDANIENSIHNGVPATNIRVSTLDVHHPVKSFPSTENITALNNYKHDLNKQAKTREYLLSLIDDEPNEYIDHIKLKASTLVHLTAATNQLTRNASLMASSKCLKLAKELAEIAQKVSYEDVQLATNYLNQCASNVITAINAPLQERSYILDLDFERANAMPDDYNTDLEFEWTHERLFADGDDFSWATIQKGRNLYYQKQAANIIINQEKEIRSLITIASSVHLNIDQNMTIRSSSASVSIKAVSSQSLPNQVTKQMGDAEIRLPKKIPMIQEMQNRTFLRSVLQPVAIVGQSPWNTNTHFSRSISLSLVDSNGTEIPFHVTREEPIELFIPRDPNSVLAVLDWEYVNLSNGTNQTFKYHSINLKRSGDLTVSVHLELRPVDRTRHYWLFYRLNAPPQINETVFLFDEWSVLCPQNLTDEGLYKHFIDNQRVGHHQFVVYALREMNASEVITFCSATSTTLPLPSRFTTIRNFTSDYELRAYTSGCYYLNEEDEWQSDGLIVGPLTNYEQTQCFSTHLTTFAGGFLPIPVTINWKYVFANASFLQNKTLYMTVISIVVLYIILIIIARYRDKKERNKLGITFLPDNHRNDRYFYQILVFTGHRKNAGTESKVHFVLSGDDDETGVRTFADPYRKIFQSGSIDGFLMAVPQSLGPLNYLHIWHDNSGQGSSASWFLKYIIIEDLQTMTKSHFICQRWFAVEEDGGVIERLLPVASEEEKMNFGYVLSKQAYPNVSDGHLWFSIFSRPSISQFTCVQRCTCCFTLLCVAMFFDLLYYRERSDTNTTNHRYTLSIGILYINFQEFLVGILVESLSLIPNLFLVQFFRQIRAKPKLTTKIGRESMINRSSAEKKDFRLTFPWWCLYIAYALSFMIVAISVTFVIARGIELGDRQTQQWLRTLIISFFSSVFLTQPLKIISLAIFFSLLCRRSHSNSEDVTVYEYFNDDKCRDLCSDENYLYSIQADQAFIIRSRSHVPPLSKLEVQEARYHRLKQLKMNLILRQLFTYLFFIGIIFFISHSNYHPKAFHQVNHLRQFLLNPNHNRYDYNKIVTVHNYWSWLEKSFIEKIRAQSWYQDEIPRNLTGFLHDRTNRMVGWALIKQSRIRSELCAKSIVKKNLGQQCQYDHRISHQEKRSFPIGWNEMNESINAIENPLVQNAFKYHPVQQAYVFELRGSIKHLRGNLSVLRQSNWIDHRTRTIEIEMNLYNPNIQMFTSIVLSTQFLSMGHLILSSEIQPIDLRHTIPISYLITLFIYIFFILYSMVEQIFVMIDQKRQYFRHIWSYLQWSIIICSCSMFGFYFRRYQKIKEISNFFHQTHGYNYISFQTITFINEHFQSLLVCCCFFNVLNLLRFAKYTRILSIYSRTIRYAINELLHFSSIFALLFLAFLFLFYLLFISETFATSSFFRTGQMLFEMLLLNFDGKTLFKTETFVASICLTFFIFFVVFFGLTIFISIMQKSFRHVRQTICFENDDDSEMFAFIWNQILLNMGVKKSNINDVLEKQDKRMRGKYFDPIENFPDKIDELYEVVHQLK